MDPGSLIAGIALGIGINHFGRELLEAWLRKESRRDYERRLRLLEIGRKLQAEIGQRSATDV